MTDQGGLEKSSEEKARWLEFIHSDGQSFQDVKLLKAIELMDEIESERVVKTPNVSKSQSARLEAQGKAGGLDVVATEGNMTHMTDQGELEKSTEEKARWLEFMQSDGQSIQGVKLLKAMELLDDTETEVNSAQRDSAGKSDEKAQGEMYSQKPEHIDHWYTGSVSLEEGVNLSVALGHETEIENHEQTDDDECVRLVEMMNKDTQVLGNDTVKIIVAVREKDHKVEQVGRKKKQEEDQWGPLLVERQRRRNDRCVHHADGYGSKKEEKLGIS
jgi:hypothetical protein